MIEYVKLSPEAWSLYAMAFLSLQTWAETTKTGVILALNDGKDDKSIALLFSFNDDPSSGDSMILRRRSVKEETCEDDATLAVCALRFKKRFEVSALAVKRGRLMTIITANNIGHETMIDERVVDEGDD